jgi:hypothetical protein
MLKSSSLVLLISISLFCPCSAQVTTTDIAVKMNFFESMIALRNKAADHLRSIETQIKDYIHQLKITGHHNMAQTKQDELKAIYNILQDKLDSRLEDINRILVLVGQRLDDDNAPLEQREQLISFLKDKMAYEVNQLIRTTELQFSR